MQLLLDVLEQTLAEPQCARRWHGLFELWSTSTSHDARRHILDRLAAHALDDPRADVLRLTFLAWTKDDARYIASAAERTLAIAPSNPDRIASFASFYSLQALQYQAARSAFVAALEGAKLPEMVNRLAGAAVAAASTSMRPRIPRAIERIAVVTPHIGNGMHTPTVLAVNQSELLVRANRRVGIYSAQELWPPNIALFHGCGGGARLPPPDGDHWQRALPRDVFMNLSDTRFSLAARWRDSFAHLAEFDPDVVLLVGLYSPLAAALYSFRPVVGLCTNAVPPLAPVDAWLTADDSIAGQQREVWHGAFPAPLACFHPWRSKVAKGPFSLRRIDIGLAPNAVVWVTVGFRLEQEISGAWAARMLDALARHPDVVWLLVGCDNGVAPQAVRHAAPGRVVPLAPRADVAAVLALCDAFVNPPRMGGGFSVVEAMAAGLPIVSFADSDGGDKAGEQAVADDAAYFQRLADLTLDSQRRAAMGGQMRERFVQRYDLERSGPSLLASCELAVTRARERLLRASQSHAVATPWQ